MIRATTAISTRTTTLKKRSDAPPAALRLLAFLLLLPLALFAHSYRLTAYPIVGGALLMAALSRPSIGGRGSRALDLAIIVTLAAIAVQLIPLAPGIRNALTPTAAAFERLTLVGAGRSPAPRPISLEPAATATALILDAALAAAFWSTRGVLRHGGVRWLARAVATIGLVLAPICVAHHLNLIPGLDQIWPVERRDLRPWGPFVNRNDFAAWMAAATALTLGYLVAHLEVRHEDAEPFDPDRAFDATGTRLALALCLMAGAIVVSLSRSGLLGCGVGVSAFMLMGRPRLAPGRRRGLTIAAVALIGAGLLFANLGALSSRLQIAMSEGVTGRLSVWSQTWPMVTDFWRVGTGVGAYRRVMMLYQTSTRLITIAHADNELLQMAAEGGLLVGVPVLALLVAFVTAVARRLRVDRSRMFWLRAGAVSGLAAVAVQNLLEMTLRVPATGLLVVVLAAIAIHERA